MNQLNQLRKALELTNEQGMNVGLSIPVLVAPVVSSIFVLNVHVSAVMTSSEMVPILNLELGQSDADIADSLAQGSSISPSPAKRGRVDNLSTPAR